MSSELHVERVSWSDQQEVLSTIRIQVFILEQGVPHDFEWDGEDEDAYHFLGTYNGKPVASGRLQANGKISRMSVLPIYRGLNFGRAVLNTIVEEARVLGLSTLYLHAQAHAAGFYRRAGFHVIGETFEEAGIPHIAMQLNL